MKKARAVWRIITRILSMEGARPQVSGFFLKSIAHSVLLFSEETWIVTPSMGQVLGGFKYQAARQLTGRLPHKRSDGIWDYTSDKAARYEVGFNPMET